MRCVHAQDGPSAPWLPEQAWIWCNLAEVVCLCRQSSFILSRPACIVCGVLVPFLRLTGSGASASFCVGAATQDHWLQRHELVQQAAFFCTEVFLPVSAVD